ncbi:MAG: SDR family oxidoreductase [Gemmatimonadaceae bacterium]
MSAARSSTGRVVVVTGVGHPGQAGEAVASALGDAGYHVVVIDRQLQTSEERARDLVAKGVAATPFACDLADAAALEAIRPAVAALAPNGLHALVHMAGGFGRSGPVAESDPEVWQRQIAINATTAYLTSRTFLPLLRQAKGSIVYFASAAALPGASVANLSAYAVAKTGVVTIMRAVASEERTSGVRANALAPTAIRTAANMATMGDDTAYVERETIARWVLFLTDEASGPISGQVIKLG